MAFVKIVKSAMGARAGIYEIRMGCALQSNTQANRNIYFAISRAVVEDVGWSPEEEGNRAFIRINVHEGTGTDAGFLLIGQTDDKKGYILGTDVAKRNTFAMGLAVTRMKHYVLNEKPVEPAPVEFSLDKKDRSILIQCPDWLRYNPLTAPPDEEVEDEELRIEKEMQAAEQHAAQVRAEELARVVPPTRGGKRTAANVALDVLTLTEQDPDATKSFMLNRQERRVLAKKVATTIGKR